MVNSSNDGQDQSKIASMEDSTAMTVQFLRARLLSERSVSKTARQRADELSKRVAELEEQLRIVSLQRKKAEKATVDVLTILEDHGLSDVSETFGSYSDQEGTPHDSKVGNNSVEENSARVKGRRNDMEAFSRSELESSPLIGRSLSWRSGKDSPHSVERKKYMDSSRRRRSSSFASAGSSSPKCVGKSCCQIRHRESRSAVDGLQSDTGLLAFEGNGKITSSEGFASQSEIGPVTPRKDSENCEEKDVIEGPDLGVWKNQRGVTGSKYFKGHRGEEDMESALEHQAQLIGRYEAEEQAQREWEDKFRENNSCTPDSCDPGTHSDVTEERDDIKAPTPVCPADRISSQEQRARLEAVAVCSSEESKSPKNFQVPSHVDVGSLQDQNCSSMIAYNSSSPDFTFPIAKREHNKKNSENHRVPPRLQSDSFSGNYSSDVSASHAVNRPWTDYAPTPRSGNELDLMPHKTSDKLGSVLEALKQAKLLLEQKLERPPLRETESVGRAADLSVPALSSTQRLDIPVGCAGLFRVPTDFQPEAATQANHLSSGSQLSLTNYSPEAGLAVTAGDRFFTSHYMEPNVSASTNDQFRAFPQIGSGALSRMPVFDPRLDMDIRSGVPTIMPMSRLDTGPASSGMYLNLDPRLSTGLPSFSKNSNPTNPIYPDFMPRMPSIEGFSRTLPSSEVGMPSSSHFPFYNDNINQNMYR